MNVRKTYDVHLLMKVLSDLNTWQTPNNPSSHLGKNIETKRQVEQFSIF